jgi:hypothetical protein
MMSGLPGTPGTSRRNKYSVIASYILSTTVSQDRFTLLEVKEMMSGLPGTPGTSKAREIFPLLHLMFSQVLYLAGQIYTA